MTIGSNNLTLINALKQIRPGTISEELLNSGLRTKLGSIESSITSIVESMSTDIERIDAFNALTLAFQQADSTLQGTLQALLNKATTDLGAETAARQAAVETLSSEISQLEAQLASLNTSFSEALASQIAAERQAREAGYTSLSEALQVERQARETSVNALTSALATGLSAANKSLTDAVTLINQNIATVQQGVDTLSNTVSGITDRLNTAFAAYDQQLNVIKSDIASTNEQVTITKQSVADVNTRVDGVVSELNAAKGNTTALEERVTTEVADLQTQLDAITSRPTDLQVSNLVGTINGSNNIFQIPQAADVARAYFVTYNGIEVYEGEDYVVGETNPYELTTIGTPDVGDKLKIKFYPKTL